MLNCLCYGLSCSLFSFFYLYIVYVCILFSCPPQPLKIGCQASGAKCTVKGMRMAMAKVDVEQHTVAEAGVGSTSSHGDMMEARKGE